MKNHEKPRFKGMLRPSLLKSLKLMEFMESQIEEWCPGKDSNLHAFVARP